jgi:lysophospholipase L1-like esterase
MPRPRSVEGPTTARFTWQRSLLFSSLVFVVFFGTVEALLRIVGGPRPVRPGLLLRLLDTDISFPFLRADPETFWAPVPGFYGEFLGERVSINGLGLRGAEVAARKPRGSRRLVTFGDSITFGYGVADSETYAARLAERARDRGLEVLNAGVTGFTSHQLLAHLRRVAPLVQADYVTICIGWNDMTKRPTTDRVYAAQLARSMAFEGLLNEVHIYRALRNLYARAAYRQLAAAPWSIARVPPNEYRENLAAVVRLCREQGIRPAFLALPHRKRPGDTPPDPTYPELLRAIAREVTVPVIEIGDLDYDTPMPANDELFIDSLHFSAAGHSRLVTVLAPQLEALGWM